MNTGIISNLEHILLQSGFKSRWKWGDLEHTLWCKTLATVTKCPKPLQEQ